MDDFNTYAYCYNDRKWLGFAIIKNDIDLIVFKEKCRKHGEDAEVYVETPYNRCMDECWNQCYLPDPDECRRICRETCLSTIRNKGVV